jgi:membrane-associated phospholipid phosphatase
MVPVAGLYAWLVWYDGPTNTLPSLHVGLAAYTLFFGARISHGVLDCGRRRLLLLAGGLWVSAIAYAALATKQHYVVDLPAGLLVAAVAHRWAWRDRRSAHVRSGFAVRSIGEPWP